MRTKFWSKKNDGVFFAKCPKDDQDETVDDGRKYRNWEYAGNAGRTLGYEEATIEGLIESAYISDMPTGDRFFNIGLQSPGRVDVLQVQLMDKDALGLAKKLRNINLALPITFGAWQNTKGAFQSHGRTIIPCYLTAQQAGQSVPSAFKYVDGKYEGIPDVVKTVKMGKEDINTDARDEFLFNEIESFIARFDKEVGQTRKNNRPQTEAEHAVATGGSHIPTDEVDDSDVPF